MDKETVNRLVDFFYGYELVAFLNLPIEDIIERFEEEIEERLDEIEEHIGIREEGSGDRNPEVFD